jgi:hypothetical protein
MRRIGIGLAVRRICSPEKARRSEKSWFSDGPDGYTDSTGADLLVAGLCA